MDSNPSLEVFSDMVVREKMYAEALAKLGEKVKHPVLKAIFEAISQDSLKHSLLYKALVDLLSSAQPVITEEEFKAILDEVDKHIETEKLMINIVKEVLDKVEDPRVRIILAAILSDEIEHHKALIDVRDKLAKMEKMGEEDIWEAIWRDSPWHGTPGG